MDKKELEILEYHKLVEKLNPKSESKKNSVKAFISGGLICGLSQLLMNFLISKGIDSDLVPTYTSIFLIFIASLLTGMGIYGKLGKKYGAGTLVPITGFANSVTAPALEYKKDGYIFGIGAKIFSISGPVIVYGIISSMIVGIVYYFFGR